jgi:hypothetical protein
VLVPQVDADGNDVGGIALPEVAVPLGTHTGWNVTEPQLAGFRYLAGLVGAFVPFARRARRDSNPATRADRSPSVTRASRTTCRASIAPRGPSSSSDWSWRRTSHWCGSARPRRGPPSPRADPPPAIARHSDERLDTHRRRVVFNLLR